MNFYHNWLYEYVLNTKWFIWIVVGTIFGLNLLSPIMFWFILNGIPFMKKNKKK